MSDVLLCSELDARRMWRDHAKPRFFASLFVNRT